MTDAAGALAPGFIVHIHGPSISGPRTRKSHRHLVDGSARRGQGKPAIVRTSQRPRRAPDEMGMEDLPESRRLGAGAGQHRGSVPRTGAIAARRRVEGGRPFCGARNMKALSGVHGEGASFSTGLIRLLRGGELIS